MSLDFYLIALYFYLAGHDKMQCTCLMMHRLYSSSIPVAVRGAYYGTGTGNILIDGLQCNGSETNIGYCDKRPLGVNNCSHTEDAGLMCLGKFIFCLYMYSCPICT